MNETEKALLGVQIIEEQILHIVHSDNPTPVLVDLMFEKGRILCSDWEKFFAIVSLPNGLIISREVREAIQKNLGEYEGRLVHIAIVAQTPAILNFAFKFVAALRPYWKYSLHKTTPEALARIRQIKDEFKHG